MFYERLIKKKKEIIEIQTNLRRGAAVVRWPFHSKRTYAYKTIQDYPVNIIIELPINPVKIYINRNNVFTTGHVYSAKRKSVILCS